jgi:hypothetical protein
MHLWKGNKIHCDFVEVHVETPSKPHGTEKKKYKDDKVAEQV